MISLKVMIAGNDGPPLKICLSATSNFQQLTDSVFDNPNTQLSRRLHRLRFIVAGKNLSPNLSCLEDAGLTDESFVHCVVTDIIQYDDPMLPGSEEDTLVLCEDESELVTIDLGQPENHEEIEEMDDGTFNDWCWGFVLGGLLGLIMVVLAMDKSIALSVKWKRGINYGTGINVLFGMFLLATGRLHQVF